MKSSRKQLIPQATATTFWITQLDFSFVFRLPWATTQSLIVRINQHFCAYDLKNWTISLAVSISDIKTLFKHFKISFVFAL